MVSGMVKSHVDGLRITRTIGASAVSYVWDLNASLPVVLQDTEGNRYVYGLDLLTRIDGSDEEWYLYDGLGSTTGLTDDTGTVTGTYEYDVFGAERAHTGDGTEWSYTGEQHDATGLEHLRARYYDAGTGRFLARDPLPLLQQYPYVANNPITRVDPSGLRWDFEIEEAHRQACQRPGAPQVTQCHLKESGFQIPVGLPTARLGGLCEANFVFDVGVGATGYAGLGGGGAASARGAISIDSCKDVALVGTGGLGGGATYGVGVNVISTTFLFGTNNAGRQGGGGTAGGCVWIGVGGCVAFTGGKGYGGLQLEGGIGGGVSFFGTVDYTKVVKPWDW